MNQEITTKSHSRNPYFAFLFSIFVPGLGQIYNGQIKKGILYFLTLFALLFLFGLLRVTTYFYGFILLLFLDSLLRIYIIYDAVKHARRQKEYFLKPYNTWYYHLAFALGILTLVYFYDFNDVAGVKNFKIPTSANEPTIKVGDKVVVDLKAYERALPNYGDIVIYQDKDSLYPYMFRVVGLPNDKIEVQKNFLTINDKVCKTTFVRESFSGQYAVSEYAEELPNGIIHNIYRLKQPFVQTDSIQSIIVPANGYFLMGDNRDNAEDSRYIGIIYKDEIKGKVVFNLWGENNDRIGLDLRNK